MNVMRGRCSEFGGPDDKFMKDGEGLSIYEAQEADKRLDLFFPRSSNPKLGTSKRLNPKALYFAYLFPWPITNRKKLQATQFLFRNPANNRFCSAWLVDRGPAEWTKRKFDVSPGVFSALDIRTDQVIEAIDLSEAAKLFEA